MKKDKFKSIRIGDDTDAELLALKRAHIGENDSDRFRLGIKCCVKYHELKVKA